MRSPNSPRRSSRAARAIPALVCAVALCALGTLAAQEILIGQPVQEVEYRGLVTLFEDSMDYFLGLEDGAVYDPEALNDRIHDFWLRGLIDDIQVEAEPVAGGVKLVVTVEERPVLRSLDYQGLDKVKRSEISDAVDRQRIELYEDTPLNLGELVRLKKAIEELYAERGFRFAEVAFDVEQTTPTERRVLVTIDEGNKVKIGQVVFEGNEIFKGSRLRSQMEKTKKTNLITRLRKRDIYNPATVAEDLEKVAELYREFGYKDVQIGEPVIEVIEKGQRQVEDDSGETSLAPKKRRLRLILPIEEGPRWRLGDIRVEGNEVLDGEALVRVFEEPKGGWLRSDVIDEGIEKIRDFYNNTGYLFAQVRHEIVERDQDALVADVLVKVSEGDQFKVGRIEFEGNTRTRDRVLRRELRIQEGMVFNSSALRNSLRKINQLEYFKLDEDDPVALEPDAEDQLVDLRVKGEEAERTELQFGGGYSEIDGFFGQASIRTRNFLGRGETLAVSAQTGRFRDIFDVSYFVPWFLDRPQSIGVQIFDNDLDFDLLVGQEFRRSSQGVVLTYGRSFRLFESLSFSYTNSDFEDFQSQRLIVDPDEPEGRDLTRSFEFQKSSLTTSYRYDSHDSRLEPTRGLRLVGSLEYAGGPLGGENYFLQPRINLAYTTPLLRRGLRTVGRINIDARYIEPFGDEDDGTARELFVLDRLFLGGENTIRGFQFNSVWVRDPETGRSIRDQNQFIVGGNKSLFVNLEHHFLTAGPFRVIAYLDAGNVYGEGQSIDFSHMRYVAGLELRVTVPLFGAPLRFIWANNLDPYDDLPQFDRERFDSFDFSIGVSF